MEFHDYHQALVIFNDMFHKEDMIPIFRELKSRDINPDSWEKQIKFWSTLIKRWGKDAEIIDFSVDYLAQMLVYQENYPPLRASIDYLVKTKVIQSRDDFIANKSLALSVASKLWNFISPNKSPSPDVYIFSNNLKETVNHYLNEVESQASCNKDVALTEEEVKLAFPDIDYEIVKAGLKLNKNVRTFNNGFYFRCSRFPSLEDKSAADIISVKTTIQNLEKKKEQIPLLIEKKINEARKSLKLNNRKKAIQCLKSKKLLESQENKLDIYIASYERALNLLMESEINSSLADVMKSVNHSMKMNIPDVGNIEEIMDEMDDNFAANDELTQAFARNLDNSIDDEEIEQELEALIEQDFAIPESVEMVGRRLQESAKRVHY
ncbi:hypothetical protein TRFO_37061 [Tritrichomonas foetus]|uniref:Charged multivesicular body protein 7 n=1 Tax=Tritrichomonas foetus TaxID=1144522 RepID=A0A1J4JBZ3_9EUKA|nr:hypothetical protein TRFO_37061 [Tritrichomonas foetus]|eukprot:OHS96722.1 hypothetical protein TRFO_37061 [Tritrichomonas foetus]